ncbi:polymorphic toxin-type HINT domain-containing protein [Flavobacterium branchiicola]|uniref:Polymorphic toxin-type HINT domain-containing protein n=1 Tax=Flavobacterium branchiicola TaxID=1114875 RepID=A0ABV9PHW2_9FLAO|nr:polymorphic toxin-type HINT domain-containing protein [Flavobacterium branchiicola]MBS7256330.1 DUF4280 domain-containing protein [Flavobacterium branchiicola]
MEELEYITKDALIMCDQGGAPDFFKPTYNNKVKIHGCLVATNKDAIPLGNIPSFKVCKITNVPCVPATVPLTWQDTWQVKIKGINSLIGKSTCQCTVGGKIEFMTSGQVPLPDDAMAEVKELQEQAQRELDDSGNGNSIGEAGFAEGLIPVWGSGRDLINDIQTGDGLGAVMNAGFLIWDVASIAAGVVSFGAATVAMQGAKTGLKATLKAGGRVIARSAVEALGKVSFKKLSKEILEGSIKLKAKLCKLVPVLGCFTGETLIKTPNGFIKIEDIQIGDDVYSYDEEAHQVCIRKVTHLFVEEVAEIVEIHTKNEVIRTTRNHPFFVNGEFKDAEQIEIGEHLFTHDEKLVAVISLNYLPKTEKVYNFEVEENHCYFVGEEGVLVLNTCPKLIESLISKIPNALKKNLQCVEFADAFKKLLTQKGIKGETVELMSSRYITDATGKVISENGYHIGTKIDNIIYDNLNPKGIPYEKWLDDLGAGFPGMSDPKITPF